MVARVLCVLCHVSHVTRAHWWLAGSQGPSDTSHEKGPSSHLHCPVRSSNTSPQLRHHTSLAATNASDAALASISALACINATRDYWSQPAYVSPPASSVKASRAAGSSMPESCVHRPAPATTVTTSTSHDVEWADSNARRWSVTYLRASYSSSSSSSPPSFSFFHSFPV